ncbi:hypothetical protein FB451DRAFT_1263654 [Mycena latifolia]|nr:hypothetical protein FB451DRAFT_1263654 [Mycena latifolia]
MQQRSPASRRGLWALLGSSTRDETPGLRPKSTTSIRTKKARKEEMAGMRGSPMNLTGHIIHPTHAGNAIAPLPRICPALPEGAAHPSCTIPPARRGKRGHPRAVTHRRVRPLPSAPGAAFPPALKTGSSSPFLHLHDRPAPSQRVCTVLLDRAGRNLALSSPLPHVTRPARGEKRYLRAERSSTAQAARPIERRCEASGVPAPRSAGCARATIPASNLTTPCSA